MLPAATMPHPIIYHPRVISSFQPILFCPTYFMKCKKDHLRLTHGSIDIQFNLRQLRAVNVIPTSPDTGFLSLDFSDGSRLIVSARLNDRQRQILNFSFGNS